MKSHAANVEPAVVPMIPPNASPQSRFQMRRVVQYALAAGVIAMLWFSGRLRLDDIWRTDFKPFWALLGLGLMLPNYAVAALRLQVVLRGMGAACTFGSAWMSTLYGAIGELSLPVFAGGDLVKAVHVGSTFNRSTAAASVVADRVIGLVGLVLFGALTCALQLSAILRDDRIRNLAVMLAWAGAATMLVIALLARSRPLLSRVFRRLAPKIPGGPSLLRLASLFAELATRPHLYYSLALAMLGHLLWCGSVLCLAYAFSLEIPLLATLLVLPLVAACNTLSFAGGIGGGTIAFDYLFEHILGTAPGAGCQVGLALPVMVNLSKLYALPWLLRGSKKESVHGDDRRLAKAA